MKIGFLLGRAPGPGSVLPSVVRRLEDHGAVVEVVHADGDRLPGRLLAMDVVALRALGNETARAASALERAGVLCRNSVAATRLARDRTAVVRRLARAGLPVPFETVLECWPPVRAAARTRQVVVKARSGSRGEHVLVPDRALPDEPPFPPPYVVQDWLPGDGVDRKLYVVGNRVAGVLRRWPPRDLSEKRGRAFEPDAALRSLARAAGETLGLELFGVDVVIGPNGPAIVDVNAFPGYKGVPDAAAWIADDLIAAARRRRLRCAS